MDTIKDNNHFLRAYKKGRYLHSGFLTVHIVPNELDSKRYGITVSKKLGNAVVRNRCKRIIRAALREIESSLPESFDYVFIARDKLCSMKSTDLLPFFTDRLLPFVNKNSRGVK
ncbi:MAG: ribonuclease P protein component [Ruminococcus sp.]|jgi:ribonuclease P protein component|nr:ribonuclease P protein component [Ruminococcus sp.]